MIEVLREFRVLCAAARSAWENVASATEYEGSYRRVLSHIQRHGDNRADFSNEFVRMLEDDTCEPTELIAYCMHVLKWDEIRSRAETLIAKSNDPRNQDGLSDVVQSFQDDWNGADLFSFEDNT